MAMISGLRPKIPASRIIQLTEGEYSFLLNAANGDGAVTEIPYRLIYYKKPAWKRWWFFPANGILLFS